MFAASKHLHVWQRTIWGLPCFETNTSPQPMCSAVVGLSFSYGAGLCGSVKWTRVPFKLCCFQSLPTGFISQRDISTKQETFFFFPSFFPFFWFGFSGTQDFSKQGVFWLYAWPFCFVLFFLSLTLCDIDACMFFRLKKKMWGSDYFVMFSVKLCNLMTNFAKTSPSEYLIWPFIFPVCLS